MNKMNCKDCLSFEECQRLAMGNFDLEHQMWLNDFWENAEQRCKKFKKREEDKK